MKVYLISSGDSRLSANQNCWAAQKELEDALASVVSALGHELVRAHPYDEEAKHKSNHIQVVYANSAEEADQCLQVKAALVHKLGIPVNLCGVSI